MNTTPTKASLYPLGEERSQLISRYWIGEQHWGKGIVADALKHLIPYIYSDEFTEMNRGEKVMRIEACVFAYNAASARVLEKCGFTLEAVQKFAYLKEGKPQDGLMFVHFRQ